jgi:predicted MFS family arabinose efflux permease
MGTSTETPAAGSPPAGGTKSAAYRNLALIMGSGIFVSTFAQTGQLGLYPFRFLLKDHLHEGPLRVALFMQLAQMPWNLKIIAGIISDGLPLFGTRRRHYLLLSTFLSGLLWLAVALVPHAYLPLVLMAMFMNIALVFVSTISGGLLVEGGQTFGATGRLSAIRVVAMNIAGLGVPVGAFLATRSLAVTAVAAAVPLFLVCGLAFFKHSEPRRARRDPRIFMGIWEQLKIAGRSRALWAASGLLFLIQFAPGFATPLLFYQTDTLHFSNKMIGVLTIVDGIAGVIGAFFYGYFCRRFPLRPLLYGSILFTGLIALLYLGYNGFRSALIIEAVYCLAFALVQLPLYDLAARATPKGSEALGYSIIVSVWNWGLFCSDLIGSALFQNQHVTFKQLVWINAATTLLVLVAVPFLPKLLVDRREEEVAAA